jgi:hypothetical protein
VLVESLGVRDTMYDILVGNNGAMASYRGDLALELMNIMYDYDGKRLYANIYSTNTGMVTEYSWLENSLLQIRYITGSIDGENGIGRLDENDFLRRVMKLGLNTYNTILVVEPHAYSDYVAKGYTNLFKEIIVLDK